MPAIMPANLSVMGRASDPKKAILDAVGNALDGIRVFNNQLLVGTYIAPEKTAGGLIIPDKSKMEDLYQGTLGLVLKKGPTAFLSDDRHDWMEQDVQVGDWVMFRFSSAWEIHLAGTSVRFVDDLDIRAVIDDPSLVTSRPVKARGG